MDDKRQISRRWFLERSALAGLAVGAGIGCREEPRVPAPAAGDGPVAAPIEKPLKREQPAAATGDWTPFPVIKVSGSPMEIGTGIGLGMRERIARGIELRREWFDDLKRFALADRKARLDGFVAAIEKHHPEVMAEMKGMAKGAGLPLDDILVLNMQTELGALRDDNASCDSCDDCSTIHLVHGERILLLHNEDGHDAYRELMAILEIRPAEGPAITALSYPGLVPGSVPGMNEAGLVMTTNFIGGKSVDIGVPRYVLGRAALSAKTIGDAVKAAAHKNAAYTFHANLGSTVEKRLVALDVAPGLHAVRRTEGTFLQTNHFLLAGTRDVPQPGHETGGSSDSRYRILEAGMKKLPTVSETAEGQLIELLASHEAVTAPFSPCRHPSSDSQGRTLATAVFNIGEGKFDLFEGNPCEGRRRELLSG